MTSSVQGDLIELAKQGEFDYIIHGCNCFNTMGAGIAKQIALAFPAAQAADNKTMRGSVRKLGDYTMALVRKHPTFYVINLYTQYQTGKDFRLEALKVGLFKIANLIPPSSRIGIPYIGAGIGGGNWTEIFYTIGKELKHHRVTIVEYEKPSGF